MPKFRNLLTGVDHTIWVFFYFSITNKYKDSQISIVKKTEVNLMFYSMNISTVYTNINGMTVQSSDEKRLDFSTLFTTVKSDFTYTRENITYYQFLGVLCNQLLFYPLVRPFQSYENISSWCFCCASLLLMLLLLTNSRSFYSPFQFL